MNKYSREPVFIYTFACSPEEVSLCRMEMRALFGRDTETNMIKTARKIDPDRSPFIKERIEVLFDGSSIEQITKQASSIKLQNQTFKVLVIKTNDLPKGEKPDYDERRKIERKVGWEIEGAADVRHPDQIFGMTSFEGRWYFGYYLKSEPVWLKHMHKPREYSTALSTRTARAIVNILVPVPAGVKAIDPCCGIGTVLVEALSMGIDMEGADINPVAAEGSRENIAFFGLKGEVQSRPIGELTGEYDAAVVDLPYNLNTTATQAEQHDILNHTCRISRRAVIVTIESMDDMIAAAGFKIVDRCRADKMAFSREILLCERIN